MTGEEEYGASAKPLSAKKSSAKSEHKETKVDGEENKKEDTSVEGEKEEKKDAKEEDKKITDHSKQSKRIKELDRTKFGKVIKSYEAGESFGEVALIKRDAYRNATVIADEDCHMMVIGEDLYDRSLKSYQEQEFEAICKFIESHPFFCDMPTKLKKLLEMSLRKDSFSYDTVLVRQGDPITGMTFITSGQANITVEPHKHQKQYPQLWPFEAGVDIYSIEFEYLRTNKRRDKKEPRRQAILRKYEDPSVWETKSEDVVIRRTEGYAAIEKRMKERHIDLCSVTAGEVIGDTEILMNLSTYLYTIKCTANTDVYILDTKNFERLIGKKNMATLETIRGYVQTKLRTRMEMKNGPLIPLLPYLYFKLTEQTLPVEKPLPPLKTSKQLPNKEFQTKHLLNLFKEGKAVLVEPSVPGVHYYKELMLEKAKAREISRKNEEMSTAAILRANKRNPRKQPRSLMAIRESLREMMEAEVIQMDSKKSKRKLKRTKKAKSNNSLASEQQILESGTAPIASISENVKGKKSKLKKKNVQQDTISKQESEARADNNNNNIAQKQQESNEPITTALTETAGKPTAEHTESDSKRKHVKPVLITELLRDKDLPAIHEERTEEEIHLHSPLTWRSPKPNNNAKPMMKKPTDLNNTHDTEKEETLDAEQHSSRLENVATVMSLENESEDSKRLILPPLRETKEQKTVSKDNTPRDLEGGKWGSAMKFVNQRIQTRLAATSLSNAPETYDFESSEPTLRLLESRIQAFHIKYGGKVRKTMKLPKLARFDTPKEEPTVPLPGGKVWVKKRSCQFATNKVRVKDHAHIRHHVVPEIPEFDQVKRTKQVVSMLMENLTPRNEMFT